MWLSKGPYSLWRWGDASFSHCAPECLTLTQAHKLWRQALHDKWLKFKLEIKYGGCLPNHSHGILWHGRSKRGTPALTHGSVQTR